MKNVIQEISQLTKPHVHIRNPDKVNEILNGLVDGGVNKLQVVSDFDGTITKQHENGKVHLSSFGIFESCPSIPKEYKEFTDNLQKKYRPIEFNPNLSKEEKAKYMEEWWGQSEQALKGLKITVEEINDVCEKYGPSIRDGCKDFFDTTMRLKIPVLVFSAGLGDTVASVLKLCNILLPNVKIISNFLKFDNEGKIEGFKDKLIHVCNKNEVAIKGSEFYDLISERENIIVMGDHIGDASMSEGMDHANNTLKIGYLYHNIETALSSYMDIFDIVLVDDQTMEVPNAILNYVSKGKY